MTDGRNEVTIQPVGLRWAIILIYFGNAALVSFQFGNYVMIPDIITGGGQNIYRK